MTAAIPAALLALSLLAPPAGGDASAALLPVGVTPDLVYGSAAVRSPAPGRKALRLDLYQPEGPAAPALRPGFVVIHGGGLMRGDRRTENVVELCREMAARGYVAVSIGYRLAGDDPPGRAGTRFARTLDAAIEDAALAVAWLRRNAARHRVDPRRIAIGGSSAGATIAMRLAYGTRHGSRVAAVLSWVGGLDGGEHLLDGGGPPLFIVHGAADERVPVAEAHALALRARRAGIAHRIVVCEALGHDVPLDRRPGGASLYDHLAGFLHAQMDLARIGRSLTRPAALPVSDTTAVPCPR